jgi:hypothetical protein
MSACCVGVFTLLWQDGHNRLTCRHTTDYVAIDVHKNHMYSFSQELGNSLKMVPARTETQQVHWLDFNKGILLLEMHGTNIKKKKIKETSCSAWNFQSKQPGIRHFN